MVLAGKTNKDLVNRIEAIGGRAIGLSGIDGGLIKAKKLNDGQFDYGCVGEIVEVDTQIIKDNIGVAIDFYNRFCWILQQMMEHNPDNEFISFMGP